MAEHDPSSSRRAEHFGLSLAAVVMAPWTFRIVLLADRASTGIDAQDLRGFLADLSVSFLFLALVLLAARATRIFAVALAVFWGVAQYGNYENIRVLGSLAVTHDLAFLAHPTFLFGSALVVSTRGSGRISIGCSSVCSPTCNRTAYWPGGARLPEGVDGQPTAPGTRTGSG